MKIKQLIFLFISPTLYNELFFRVTVSEHKLVIVPKNKDIKVNNYALNKTSVQY